MWTPKDIVFITVKRDCEFFENIMQPKLKLFYYECLLLEIIDPGHTRNMAIREPSRVTDAIKMKNK